MSDKHQPEAALPRGPAQLRNVLVVPALCSWPLVQRGHDHFLDFTRTPLLSAAKQPEHVQPGISLVSEPESTLKLEVSQEAPTCPYQCYGTQHPQRSCTHLLGPHAGRDHSRLSWRHSAGCSPCPLLLAVWLPVPQMRFRTCCFRAMLSGAPCARRELPASLPGDQHRGSMQQGTSPALRCRPNLQLRAPLRITGKGRAALT